MIFKTQKVLGVNITINSRNNILEEVQKYLQNIKNQKSKIKSEKIKPMVIYTPNPEIITYAQRDSIFKKIVNTAQIDIPDGSGVVWAIKKLFGIRIEKIAGIDFMLQLVTMAQKEGLTIGLIGGRGKLADRTAECLRSQYKSLKIEVFEAPEFEISKIKNKKSKIYIKNQKEDSKKYFQNLADEIIKKKTDILFVALGFPKQEYFIENIKNSRLSGIHDAVDAHSSQTSSGQISNIKYDKPIILMTVGGAFDYISGKVPRAPEWIRNLGLEWWFRLIVEPWRLSRQIKGVKYFLDVLTSQ